MIRRCVILGLGIAVLFAASADAQESTAFDGLLRLITTSTGNFAGSNPDPTTTIVLLDTFAAQVTTFPLGSSASAFTYAFDPSIGASKRRSESFGPTFADRPLTNGKGKLNVAVAYQHTNFKSIAGQPLDNLVSTYSVLTSSGARVGTLNAESQIELSTDRTTISASYGLTDRVDVAVVVPFGRTVVAGNSQFRVFNLQNVLVNSTSVANVDTSSSGIGDIVVRGKATLPSPEPITLAVGADLRLPTGDSEKLLGIGSRSASVALLGAGAFGRVSPHFNVGYKFASSGGFFDTADEVTYIVGADLAATPTVTIVGDVIGRALRDAASVQYVNQGGLVGFSAQTGSINLVVGTVGTKINIPGTTWLVTANVLFPLNSAGVKPGITPVIGLERSFLGAR